MSFLHFLRKVLGCHDEITRLQRRGIILAGEREYYKKGYESVRKQLDSLQGEYEALELMHEESLKAPPTSVVADTDRITVGRLTKDKPSAHSPLTRTQLRNVSKNIIATNRDYYIVELYGDTNSMEPDIDDNYILSLKKYNSIIDTINIRDIVHYIHPNSSSRLLHRVEKIRIKKGIKEYYIRGDNNPWGDGWFTDEAILGIVFGKVWGVEPDGESND